MYESRIWVPGNELKKEVLKEADPSAYSIHPGSTKIYKDLKKHYWWNGIKKDFGEYVAKIKIKH